MTTRPTPEAAAASPAARTGPPDTRVAAAAAGDKAAALDRAYLEYNRLWEDGRAPDPESFVARYPEHRSSLRRVLQVHHYLAGLPGLFGAWPAAGERVGDLTIVRELGRGGLARVYLATEASTGDRPVAVKFSPGPGGDEARTLGRLAHPNVVPVLSTRFDEATGMTAVLMPYLGAGTLHDVLDRAYPRPGAPPPRDASVIHAAAGAAAREGDPPPAPAGNPPRAYRRYADAVAALGVELCGALAFVHARGVCHRDLKPSNVLLTPGGRPLLLDFNLSAGGAGGDRVGGTLPYMAPEQIRALLDPGSDAPKSDAPKSDAPKSDAPGPRADLFALGVILYELLTGELPFGPLPPGDPHVRGPGLVVRQRAGCRPLRAPGVGRPLARLVERCLAFEPADRPASAAELGAGLRRCLARRSRAAAALLTLAFLTAVGLAAYPALAPAGRPATSARAREAYRRGLEALRSGDNPAAEAAFAEAVRIDPAFGPAWLGRGRAQLRIADMPGTTSWRELYPKAVAFFQEANDREPSPTRKAWEGYALTRLGGLAEAEACFGEAEAGGLRTAALYNDRAYVRLESHDYCGAAADLAEALALDDKLGAAYHNRAWLAFRLWEQDQEAPFPAEAAVDALRALRLGPPSPDASVDAARFSLLAAPPGDDAAHRDAIARLRDAVDAGWPAENLTADPRFVGPLDRYPEFRALSTRPKPARQPPRRNPRILEPGPGD